MALKPVSPNSPARRGAARRAPLQYGYGSGLTPAYVKKTKSHAGLWVFLLLAAAGGAFYYIYTHQNKPEVKAPRVIVVGEAPSEAAQQNKQERPKQTALGTVAPVVEEEPIYEPEPEVEEPQTYKSALGSDKPE